ncbi:MAG: DUF2834 domain-containing protein [Candidatus Altiarchaeota archaeon]|nr:DUF2834 domain-containing protein [Candidatus Altiarchaeota archaeon]
MERKHVYLILCFLAVVLTYSRLIPYLLEGNASVEDFFKPFYADYITQFYMADLLVTAVACMAFMLYEANRIKMPKVWIPIASTFLVGISLGLPLFLYMREDLLEKGAVEMGAKGSQGRYTAADKYGG